MKPYQKENRFFACGQDVYIAETEKGETHVFSCLDDSRLSDSDLTFGEIYGGGEDADFEKTCVIMRSGFVKLLCGGGKGGNIGNVNVELLGGMVGENVFGGGFEDNVKTANIKVCGGAVKHCIFSSNSSKSLENANIEFSSSSCTYIFSGAENPNTKLNTSVKFTMFSGTVLSLICGSNGQCLGNAEFNILGGRVEREISYKNFGGKLKLNLYENLFVSGGPDEIYPILPQKADITFLPEVKTQKMPDFKKTDYNLLSVNDNELTFLFFELRHPKIPKNATPFPYFIGSCVYIQFPNGENMLLDTGNDYNADEIFSNLKKLNVKSLDYLLITHFHKDHIGCADKIIENFNIGKVILPDILTQPKEKDAPYYERMKDAIKNKNCNLLKFSRGMSLKIGEVEILCLNPIKNADFSMNDCSVALKFSFRNNSALLGGDIGDEIEKELCILYGSNLKCDLLKLSHHGITDQSYYEYINHSRPNVIIIDNLREYGGFVKTTTYSLKNVNKIKDNQIFITGKHGLIKAEFSGDGKPKISYQYEIKEC